MLEVDIGTSAEDVANKLSNFTEFHFYVDGIFCASMEGFLQSLKFEDIKKQSEVCCLVGRKAKFKGKKRKWFLTQTLFWNGVVLQRDSIEYQNLLDKAFTALFGNELYKECLMSTRGCFLTHSIGKREKKDTVLTIDEFCGRLMQMRDYN